MLPMQPAAAAAGSSGPLGHMQATGLVSKASRAAHPGPALFTLLSQLVDAAAAIAHPLAGVGGPAAASAGGAVGGRGGAGLASGASSRTLFSASAAAAAQQQQQMAAAQPIAGGAALEAALRTRGAAIVPPRLALVYAFTAYQACRLGPGLPTLAPLPLQGERYGGAEFLSDCLFYLATPAPAPGTPEAAQLQATAAAAGATSGLSDALLSGASDGPGGVGSASAASVRAWIDAAPGAPEAALTDALLHALITTHWEASSDDGVFGRLKRVEEQQEQQQRPPQQRAASCGAARRL